MMSDGQVPETTRPETTRPLPNDAAATGDGTDSTGGGPVDITRLVIEHHVDVYRYAYRLAGSVADAEDLTQQTFLLAQAHRAQLRDPALARRWLFSILRHEFFRGQRKQRPTPAGMLADVCDAAAPADSLADGPIDQEALQRALNELPDEFKTVLLLFYFEDRSYREIAEELALPLGTVMSRLSRAKRHLRGKLSGPELEKHAATREKSGESKGNGKPSPTSAGLGPTQPSHRMPVTE